MSVSIEADLYDFIKDNIRHWVGKNFGSQELDNPSWDIEALTYHLTKALYKRDRSISSMANFTLTVYLKEMSDEKRAELMSRITNKLDRVGGSLEAITSSHEEFSNAISGETKGIKVTIGVNIPTNRYAVRGFNRWLERQQEGNGSILRFMLEADEGLLFNGWRTL